MELHLVMEFRHLFESSGLWFFGKKMSDVSIRGRLEKISYFYGLLFCINDESTQSKQSLRKSRNILPQYKVFVLLLVFVGIAPPKQNQSRVLCIFIVFEGMPRNAMQPSKTIPGAMLKG